MKEQRNGDGDTLEVIQAVWGEFGVGSILFHGTVLHPTDGEPHWDALLKWYKIRAKHADRFDKDCMSFETWARAAIGRGDVQQEGDGKTSTYTHLGHNGFLTQADGEYWGAWVPYEFTWTAIPRAEAPAAGEGEPAAEAQGGSTLRDVAVLASKLDTSQTCDPDHHALVVAAMDALENDRPAFDAQAVVDSLAKSVNIEEMQSPGALDPTAICVLNHMRDALQAGIGGGE